jgi:hypothetical protein
MRTKVRGDFLTHNLWFQNALSENVILCGVSALENLEMFTGYIEERIIDVYAKTKGIYENINYIIVPDFKNINYVRFGNVLCTTFEQTVNDMLSDFDNADTAALAEALANFYFSNAESFEGLNIKPENIDNFEYIKDWAMDYYSI